MKLFHFWKLNECHFERNSTPDLSKDIFMGGCRMLMEQKHENRYHSCCIVLVTEQNLSIISCTIFNLSSSSSNVYFIIDLKFLIRVTIFITAYILVRASLLPLLCLLEQPIHVLLLSITAAVTSKESKFGLGPLAFSDSEFDF
jgi:hypothetical protein